LGIDALMAYASPYSGAFFLGLAVCCYGTTGRAFFCFLLLFRSAAADASFLFPLLPFAWAWAGGRRDVLILVLISRG